MTEYFRYLPALIWIILLVFVLTRHIRVYRLYDKQLNVVRRIEAEGVIETGSTLVAINQRVRYIIRMSLAVAGIAIGIGGLYGVYNPGFGQGLVFGLAVLGYFYGSEAATGYLTIRDERVLGHILAIDKATTLADNTTALEENTKAIEKNTEARDDS